MVLLGDLLRIVESTEEVKCRRELIYKLTTMPEVLFLRANAYGIVVTLKPKLPETWYQKLLFMFIKPQADNKIIIPWLEDPNRKKILL